jgi:RNA polymerase sigma-70 factor (ECF subfamily)
MLQIRDSEARPKSLFETTSTIFKHFLQPDATKMRFRDCINEVSASDSGGGGSRKGPSEELEAEKRWLIKAKVDIEQFSFFYKKYYPRIYRFLYWKTLDPDLTKDLTQDTFVKAQQNLTRYRWQGRTFSAWLYKIAYSVLLKDARNQARWEHWGEEKMQNHPSSLPDPLAEITKKEDLRILLRCLAKLDGVSRDIFFLRFDEKLRIKEIAAILDMKAGTIKSRLKRDIKKLQKIWPDSDPSSRKARE